MDGAPYPAVYQKLDNGYAFIADRAADHLREPFRK